MSRRLPAEGRSDAAQISTQSGFFAFGRTPHGNLRVPSNLRLGTPARSTRRLAVLRAQGFGPGDPRFEDLVTRYDAEIAATDEAPRRLFRGLAELGVLDHTLV